MGSIPESIRYVLQQLQCRPQSITWGPPQHVTLHRGANNKLGFHFNTITCGQQTVTIVRLVKPDCHITAGHLHAGHRIVSIGDLPLTGLDEPAVKHVLSESKGSVVHLQVSAMNRADPSAQVKRFLSINSGASSSSNTASEDSAERPQVKRFAVGPETPPPSSSHQLADIGQPPVVTPHSPRLPVARQGSPAGVSASRARYLSRLSPHNNNHSLPTRMDDIVHPDNIVLSEVDGPSSLPAVLTPLPNTPSPPVTQTPSRFFVRDCAEQTQSGTASYHSLGVEVCRAPDCSMQKVCLWHKFVLSNPQYVIWDPFTKTVVLEKSSASFGFKYKVKKHDGPPAEVFALVTEVQSGGAAWTMLLPGDWIRSINSTPVSNAKEAFRPDFRNLSSLRLVIQRPDGLSPKSINKLQQQASDMRIRLRIPPPPAQDAPPHQPSPVTTNKSQGSAVPILYRRNEEGEHGLTSLHSSHSAPSASDPLLEQYPRQAQSPGEHIPLTPLARSSDQCVLPRARVLVCGAHGSAADFARGLLGECAGGDVDPEALVQSFYLSLHHGVDFRTVVQSQPKPLATLVQESEMGGTGRLDSERGLRCVNVELYVINDENFFHHCASWLLPTTTLVIFTFNAYKFLNQADRTETCRLVSMMHTVRACSKNSSNMNTQSPEVLMYGIQSGLQRDISREEVQAFFYVTDSNGLLDHHSLTVSSMAVPTCSNSMAAARQTLFSVCEKHVYQVQVQQCVPKMVDILSGLSGVKLSGRELTALVSRVTGDASPALLQTVVHDLLTTGNLVLCGGNRASNEIPDQDFLLPVKVFQALSSLFIMQELDTHSPDARQKWIKLLTTGRASRFELLDILASEASPLTVDILEHLDLVFRFQSSSSGVRGDSGFMEDTMEFVIPYFLMDLAEDSESGSDSDQFVLTFQGYVSWKVYFHMLSKLSVLPATQGMVVQGQCDCVVRHDGLQLQLHWRKTSASDSVLVSAVRLDRQSREKVSTQQLERLFRFVIPPNLSFTLRPADTVYPSSDLPSRGKVVPPCNGRQPRAVDEEETLLKPAARNYEESSSTGSDRSSQNDLLLKALPWSVLKEVAILLTVTMVTGHDWKSVADRTGKSIAQIFAYEAIKSDLPAMVFLRDWMSTGTIQQLLNILDEIERPDVRDVILKHLGERTQSP